MQYRLWTFTMCIDLIKELYKHVMVCFLYLVIHAFEHYFISFCSSHYLFLSWPSHLFVLLVLLITTNIKYHLISLVPDCSCHVFSCIFMLIPWNIPVLLCLPFSRPLFFPHIFFIIYCWAFFPFIADILVVSSCFSLPSRFFHLSIQCPFSTSKFPVSFKPVGWVPIFE